MKEERIIKSTLNKGDGSEVNLRPKTLAEYIGQQKIKDNLSVFIKASELRGDTLDHVLLYGPPGLGKTTLANIIANELKVQIKITSGPAIERAADLASIITALQPNDILFIDEIHRLNRSIEEILYPSMEDFALDIVLGKGPGAHSLRMKLPRFTLIGATTRAGMLTSPLRDRFGIIMRLEMYSVEELKTIITRSAKILSIEIEEKAALNIASRSRGTPRIANRLLKRVRDFTAVQNKSIIDLDTACYALDKLEVDGLGLDVIDKNLILTMIEKFNGGPVGLDTISASINEDAITIEDAVEPYLLQLGFISRSPRGRVVMPLAYKHFGIRLPRAKEEQLSLFSNYDEEK